MSMFTLAISCLTTSNLPWFRDLTFQVPMQYCSLQHQTLLPSPVTFTVGCCFRFGSISSFFLELFLHWSPVAHWAPTDLGSSSFCVLSFCLFTDSSLETVMPSNHLILCILLLLLPSIFPSIRVFSSEPAVYIRWPENWSFSFSISFFCEYSRFISFKIDWLISFSVQGTHKSLLIAYGEQC